MNINVNLRRNANGKLRPDMAEPTTPTEAKAYHEAMKTADRANDFLDSFTKLTDDLQKSDNSENDLNSAEGVVVNCGPFKSGETRDSLEQSQVLHFDTETGQAQRYEESVEGTVFRSTKKTTSHTGREFAFHQSERYIAGPLLDLQSEVLMSIPDDSSRFLKHTTSLKEASGGLLVFEVVEQENNLYEK